MGITVRKEEIGIMKLMGASDIFVRAPFMVEGLMIGLIGAVIPIVVLFILYNRIVVSLLRGIVLMLIMSISLSKLFGMTGVWSSFPATELITAVVCVVFFILKNNRMRKHNNI